MLRRLVPLFAATALVGSMESSAKACQGRTIPLAGVCGGSEVVSVCGSSAPLCFPAFYPSCGPANSVIAEMDGAEVYAQELEARSCDGEPYQDYGIAYATVGLGSHELVITNSNPGSECVIAVEVVRGADCGDGDSDGVPDEQDNCALVANADQRDTDGDGSGDVCDADDDGDGCGDDVDQAPLSARTRVGSYWVRGTCADGIVYESDASDSDGDGAPNCRDKDDDSDGIADLRDRCPIHGWWLGYDYCNQRAYPPRICR